MKMRHVICNFTGNIDYQSQILILLMLFTKTFVSRQQNDQLNAIYKSFEI